MLKNPSIRDEETGNVTKNAAFVLSGTKNIIDNFLFLPELQRLPQAVSSLIKLQTATELADAFLSHPIDSSAHREAILRQGLMFMQFLRLSDFTSVISQDNVIQRTNSVTKLWEEFSGSIVATPEDFVQAFFMAPDDERFTADEKKQASLIRYRFFQLFEDTVDDSPAMDLAVAAYDQFLAKNAEQIRSLDQDDLLTTYYQILEQFPELPLIGDVVETLKRPFYLPEPSRSWKFVQGEDFEGQVLTLPKGTIIHSTARKANRDSLTELNGMENLYMVYGADKNLAYELAAARNQLDPRDSFLRAPNDTDEAQVLLPRNQLVVVSDLHAADIIGASIAEPGFFRRTVVPISQHTLDQNVGLDLSGSQLIGAGGWLQNVTIDALQPLKACQKADYFVAISRVREYVANGFQKQSLKAVIYGEESFRQPSEVPLLLDPSNQSNLAVAYSLLEAQIGNSLSLQGKQDSIWMNQNWDEPSKVESAEAPGALSDVIIGNRILHLITNYQQARGILASKMELPEAELFAPVLPESPLDQISDEQSLLQVVASFRPLADE
ncbi:MAG: hypothetical protein HRU19_22440 [Pseudobacteriovorax sp.]|nr:hypothetical protein [Pseudobacteriovorax sp.]